MDRCHCKHLTVLYATTHPTSSLRARCAAVVFCIITCPQQQPCMAAFHNCEVLSEETANARFYFLEVSHIVCATTCLQMICWRRPSAANGAAPQHQAPRVLKFPWHVPQCVSSCSDCRSWSVRPCVSSFTGTCGSKCQRISHKGLRAYYLVECQVRSLHVRPPCQTIGYSQCQRPFYKAAMLEKG